MDNFRLRVIGLVILASVFLSCEVIWRDVVDKTATFNYFAEKFGSFSNKMYPRTCYKFDLNFFKKEYNEYTSISNRDKDLIDVKHERNKLFISTIDSYKPQKFLASNIGFTLVDSKGNLIKNKSFMYVKEMHKYDDDGWSEIFYRYNYLFILDETLSRRNMDKDRWPIFLTVRFPDGKYIKYKFY